jgi:hypothetical protein
MLMSQPTNPKIIVFPAQITTLGAAMTATTFSWPVKDPSENITYGGDFRLLIDGRNIVQIDPYVNPGDGLFINRSELDGSVAYVTVSGGVVGQTPQIGLVVTLSDGEQISRAVNLPIAQLGLARVNQVPANAVLANGQPITANGQFILTTGD